MLQEILYAFSRTVIGFILLIVLTRLMGRKAISQMTFFNFCVAITIGAVTANVAIGLKSTPTSTITALVTLALLGIVADFLHMKSFKASKLLNSEPVVIIEKGKLNNENMKKVRFTIEELTAFLRTKNVFNIADVEFALLENDGQLSVLPKSQNRPLTPLDMSVQTSYEGLTKDIIIDGKLMEENLKDANLTKEWLADQLISKGVNNMGEVFYAGIDTAGSLFVSIRNKRNEKHGKYGIE